MTHQISALAQHPSQGPPVRLTLLCYLNDNVAVVYSPALDLYGYAHSEAEAMESFRIALDEYISYTNRERTLRQDLESHGWSVSGDKITAPDFATLYERSETLRDVVDRKSFRKLDLPVEFPSIAA